MLLNYVLLIVIASVIMVGIIVPSVFADHYSDIKIKNAKTQIIEGETSNLIRISLTIDNESTQQFTPNYGYLTKNFASYYQSTYFTNEPDICPNVNPNVAPGLEKKYILCYEVPKSFSSNFRLTFMDWSSEYCLEKAESTNPYTEQCEKTSFHPSSIPNGKKMSIESFLKIMSRGESTEKEDRKNAVDEAKNALKRTPVIVKEKIVEEEEVKQALEYIQKNADIQKKINLEKKIAKLESELAEEKSKKIVQSEVIVKDGMGGSVLLLDEYSSTTWDGAPNAQKTESDLIIVDDSMCGSGTMMKDGKCVSIDSICGSGTMMKDGKCVSIDSSEGGGGCLIATATYGSEMSQQVQQLRELRDNQLLQTESGTVFMSTFNDIYYSFSPIIADYERENPYFKKIVRIAITPMISSLSLMENANSELEVLGLGLSVIALNLGMYIAVPAVVIVGIRKIN